MTITGTTLGILISAALLFVQTPSRPAFEVASIRPAGPTPPGTGVGGVRIDGAQFRSSYLALKDYVAMAYQLKLYQIAGPDWIGGERFDIAGTLPEGSEPSQVGEMMQSLLEDRFQLKSHREKKEFPVYSLQIAKSGLKMTEAQIDPSLENIDPKAPQEFSGAGSNQGISIKLGRGSTIDFGNNKFDAKRLTMADLAATLERFLDRPIVDKTGLTGSYDLSVTLTSEDYMSMLIRSAVAAGVVLPPEALRILDQSSTPSSLFEGLNKLGLTLEATKAPLDLLVIDSVLRKPTEN